MVERGELPKLDADGRADVEDLPVDRKAPGSAVAGVRLREDVQRGREEAEHAAARVAWRPLVVRVRHDEPRVRPAHARRGLHVAAERLDRVPFRLEVPHEDLAEARALRSDAGEALPVRAERQRDQRIPRGQPVLGRVLAHEFPRRDVEDHEVTRRARDAREARPVGAEREVERLVRLPAHAVPVDAARRICFAKVHAQLTDERARRPRVDLDGVGCGTRDGEVLARRRERDHALVEKEARRAPAKVHDFQGLVRPVAHAAHVRALDGEPAPVGRKRFGPQEPQPRLGGEGAVRGPQATDATVLVPHERSVFRDREHREGGLGEDAARGGGRRREQREEHQRCEDGRSAHAPAPTSRGLCLSLLFGGGRLVHQFLVDVVEHAGHDAELS